MEPETDNDSIEPVTAESSATVVDTPGETINNITATSASNENSIELVTMTSTTTTESHINFITKDETTTNWKNSRSTHCLPLSTAVSDLYNIIAKDAGYSVGSFSLFWRKQDTVVGEQEIELTQYSTATLYEMNMPEDPSKVYLLIKEKEGVTPQRDQSNNNTEAGEVSTRLSDTDATSNDNNSWTYYSNPTYNANVSYNSSSYTGYSSYSYGSNYGKSETGFVGLVNQAMTCYLNSLLQTLYMTPEFRNAIYDWRFLPKEEGDDAYRQESAKCIPHQLQRLFLLLQCSDKRAVETTDITTSFGWDGSEAWQQHDVQELCRVMFDALEKRFKKDHAQGNLINELYQGKWRDYVKCKKCGHESCREDTFLDIPLVIKPFGMTVTYKSVQEALTAFVEPETLDGDNQYFCEKCNEKQDAQKGLKFHKFPYLLTLQLKRFDFDYSTMHRIKLNDRVSFPKILNLNEFVNSEGEKPPVVEDLTRYSGYVVDTFDTHSSPSSNPSSYNNVPSYTTELPSYAEATASSQYSKPVSTNNREKDEQNDTPTTNDEEQEECVVQKPKGLPEMFRQGPFVYELFSIMIHSGSAIGGHYYAYIKSFTDKRWYCFNDQSVSRITQEDIEQTFGGTEKDSRGYYSSVYSSSANAYMLMYRRISLDENKAFVAVNLFPPHLKKEMDLENQKAVEKKKRQEMEKKMCKFKLFGRDFTKPDQNLEMETKIEINEDTPFPEALKQAYRLLKYSGHIPLEQCRLVKYDDYSETMDQSLDIEEFGDQTFGQVVGGARTYYSFELFLETRKENEQFLKYNRGGIKVKLLLVDLATGEITQTPSIRAEHGWTVGEFKKYIGELHHIDPTYMQLVLEMYNDGRHMSNDKSSLRSEGLYRKHSVFVSCDPYDSQKPFNDSLMCKHVESYVNSILLNITLPPQQNKLPLKQSDEDQEDEIIPDLVSDTTCSNNDNSLTVDEDSNNIESPNTDTTDGCLSDNNNNTSHSDTNRDNTNDGSRVGPVITGGDEDEGIGEEVVSTPEQKTDNGDNGRESDEKKQDGEEDEVIGKRRDIELRVDRRTTLSQLKKKLEELVGVESIYFKMYRVYNNQQEYEMERLTDTLMSTPSESKIVVRLGRALQPGECRVKLFLLRVNDSEFFKLMMESIVAKNTPIREFKKQIEIEAKKQGIDCELKACRMRIRKKVWRTPGTVYLDNLLIDKDVYLYAGSELFVEPLETEELMTSASQMQLYIKRWRPSEYILDPLEELILDTSSIEELKRKISERSSIPVDRISIAKGSLSFPADMSVLDVESDLDWDPAIKTITQSPFSLYDDGGVVYYKDSSEKLLELSVEKKNELRKSEGSRLTKNSIQGTGSSSYTNYTYYRKEKALKIYSEDDTVETTTNRES